MQRIQGSGALYGFATFRNFNPLQSQHVEYFPCPKLLTNQIRIIYLALTHDVCNFYTCNSTGFNYLIEILQGTPTKLASISRRTLKVKTPLSMQKKITELFKTTFHLT